MLSMELTMDEMIEKNDVEGNAESVFINLILPLKKQLFNYILKTLSFSEDAEDVFQEVVLRAYRYFNSYKSEKSFSIWIYSIAHNEIKRYFKQRGKRIVEIINENLLVDDLKDNSDKNKIIDVYHIAERLKPKQREVFFLFYYNGFCIKDIVQICNLKEGNIKYILNGARNAIKEILGEKNEE